MQNYTQEQIKDVQEREEKALNYLKELQLSPAVFMQKVNLGIEGKDIFADQVTCYLRDLKYENQPNKENK